MDSNMNNDLNLWESVYRSPLTVGTPIKFQSDSEYASEYRDEPLVVSAIRVESNGNISIAIAPIHSPQDITNNGWHLDHFKLDIESKLKPSSIAKNYRIGQSVVATESNQYQSEFDTPMYITGVEFNKDGSLELTIGGDENTLESDGWSTADFDVVNSNLLESKDDVAHWISGQAAIMKDNTLSISHYYRNRSMSLFLRDSLEDSNPESQAGLSRRARLWVDKITKLASELPTALNGESFDFNTGTAKLYMERQGSLSVALSYDTVSTETLYATPLWEATTDELIDKSKRFIQLTLNDQDGFSHDERLQG
jgi:hypothetical protein